jgi:polyhydroxyalkanoate synthesis regulator phasin
MIFKIVEEQMEETTVRDAPEEAHSKRAEEMRNNTYEMLRKLLLASIGAAVVAEEEISAFIKRLIERGELAEKDARNLMKEVMDRREKIYRERTVETEHSQATATATRSDINALNARIADLTRQIEELKEMKSKS